MGERGVRNAEVEGSNPLPSTIPRRSEGRGRATLPAFVLGEETRMAILAYFS